MYRYFAVCLVVAGVCVPVSARATVLISEIAWMGTSVDNGSFCEWVELANDGTESVSLSGWVLKTLDAGMTVSLSGSIEAGGFYLIERATPSACPDPVPGIDADLSRSFGGGLSNAGEKLVLLDGTVEIDHIDASGGWEGVVGGDSAKKYTAQRSVDGWVTAPGTPRAANATESVIEPTATSTSSTPAAKKVVGNPIPSLSIDAGGDRIVSTKAHTPFRPIVYDSTGRHVKHPYVTWAFGDGDRSIGVDVEHAYREPGEYLVVIRAQERYSHGTASLIVTADPADIEIASLSEKGIALHNRNTRILDLSRYSLVSGKESFRIPVDTSILPGRTVIFPPEVTGLSTTTSAMELRYPSGEVAFSYAASSTPPLQPEQPIAGTNTVRPVDVKTPQDAPSYDPTIGAPARTVEPVGAGARLDTRWLETLGYRRLSTLSS